MNATTAPVLTAAQRRALEALAKAAQDDAHRYWTASDLDAQGRTMLALARMGYARMLDTVAARVGYSAPTYKVTLSGLGALGRLARAERDAK